MSLPCPYTVVVALQVVAYPSVGITLSVNHIYTSVSFQFLLSTTCYNAVKSLILRKKGKRNSVESDSSYSENSNNSDRKL